jgi:hypothetical protein
VEACEDQNGPAAVATGEGALRLTRNYGTAGSNAAGTLLYNTSLSAFEGIDISFAIRMDDGNVADGMSFFLKDGSNVTNSSGTAGGALGYALTSGTNGVPGALFGIGFDKLGNFSPPASEANRIVLRGPDTSGAQNGGSGYCYLGATTSAFSSTAFQRVRVVMPPYTAGQPTTVSVYLAPSVTPDVLPLAPTLTSMVTISATSFKFGFSAATGSWTNSHDLRGLVIRPAGPAITAVGTSESTGSGTGPTSGGTLLTITGTGIDPAATVTVDGQPCTGVSVTGGGTPDPPTTPPTTTTPTTTTAPVTPVPAPTGDLPALGSAETLVTEDGELVAVELVVENDEALVLRSQDFELRLRRACTTGCTITEDTTGRETIHLDRNGGARVSGFGFLPGSLLHVWIFSEPRYLGALLVAADGTYEGTFPLDDIDVGGHTLQANGYSFDNVPRSANLGIALIAPARRRRTV